jgi:hypothetical protein
VSWSVAGMEPSELRGYPIRLLSGILWETFSP